jgi:hypothetical protein
MSGSVGRYGQDAVGLHGNAGEALAPHGDLGDRVGTGERVGITLGWEVVPKQTLDPWSGTAGGVRRQCIGASVPGGNGS